jgi:nicotinate-nucleotide--dimethylbenzimidazole phosphoribosyltransferase
MVLNFLAGGAAANVLARMVGASVKVVDVSVDADPAYAPPDVVRHRIRRGSGSIHCEDAMTREETTASLDLGDDLAATVIDAQADIVIPGDMGIGNTTPATTLICILTSTDPASAVGRGTGIDDATLTRKAAAISLAIDRGRAFSHEPLGLLAAVGSPDIAAMTGLVLGAARRGVPVILDGIVSCAAALVARQMDPAVVAWMTAGHLSTEPAARVALASLGLVPVVDLQLRLGEGTGALLALNALNAAAVTLAEMATFDSAGVSNRDV